MLSDPNHPHYRNFRDNSRSYNCALSFGSMGANIQEFTGTGPYCFKVQGQIYHRTSNLHAPDGQTPKYAQLYVLESSEANEHRMNEPANQNCLQEIIQNIDGWMRANNIFAKTYKMMHEIELEQI